MTKNKVAIIGGGAIGQAIGKLCEPEALVGIYDISPERATVSDPALLEEVSVIFLCVPTEAIRPALSTYRPYIKEATLVVGVSKGLEQASGKLLVELLAEILPEQPTGILYGPMIAADIMAGQVTKGILASRVQEAGELLQGVLNKDLFSFSVTTEVEAVCLLGVLKNIYALGFGILLGQGSGTNTKACFSVEALAEMKKILGSLGYDENLAYGPAGLGDFLATAYSEYSKNQTAGLALATGAKPLEAEGLLTLRNMPASWSAFLPNCPILTILSKIVAGEEPVNNLIDVVFHH